jgi:hypothetical protein
LAMRAKTANFWVGYLYNLLLFPLFLQRDYIRVCCCNRFRLP